MVYSSLGLYFYAINGIVFAVAFRYWFRTRHTGFAWVAAGYGLTMVSPFLFRFLFTMLRQYGQNFFYFTWSLAIPLACGMFIVFGLRSFAYSAGPPPETLPDGDLPEPRPPIPWSEVKRRGFGVAGVVLIVGGIFTIIRGINFMLSPGGEVADLGAGPGAIVVGLLCLLLSLHPRSPLRVSENDAS